MLAVKGHRQRKRRWRRELETRCARAGFFPLSRYCIRRTPDRAARSTGTKQPPITGAGPGTKAFQAPPRLSHRRRPGARRIGQVCYDVIGTPASGYGATAKMADRWLFETGGQAAFYQVDKYLYAAKTNQCAYWIQNGWIYEVSSGRAAFFIQDKWVYTPSGSVAFFFGD